jgi:2-dehydropantoate 2-reductase
MRILVMGTGGVGGYFGALLARGGHEVGFVARGAHLAAMRENGLQVESPLGNIHLPRVTASDDPGAFGVPDVVLFCVKLWDTEAAARAIQPIVGPRTIVLSLQNGVQKDDIIAKAVGADAVVGGVCYVASRISKPGVIAHTGDLRRIVCGAYPGHPREEVVQFHEVCAQSGIDTVISPDIRRTIWEKFVFLVGLSAATATMASPIGPIRKHPVARAFLLELMREVVAVGRALGVALDERYAEDRLAFADSVSPDLKSSMLNDFENGRRLEVAWLSGHVAELGMQLGIPTPCNRAVNAILALHAEGKSQ